MLNLLGVTPSRRAFGHTIGKVVLYQLSHVRR